MNFAINTPAKIINSEGIIVKDILLQPEQTIDVSNLPAGLYFIQTQLAIKKIVISR